MPKASLHGLVLTLAALAHSTVGLGCGPTNAMTRRAAVTTIGGVLTFTHRPDAGLATVSDREAALLALVQNRRASEKFQPAERVSVRVSVHAWSRSSYVPHYNTPPRARVRLARFKLTR